MALPKIVSQQEWDVAREALLVEEKELTRARDALNTKRRELPMVEITKEYVFEGLDRKATLLDLFDGRRQLVIAHFMFDPRWDDGCSSCTAGADEVSDGFIRHLHTRDTSLAYVSRAPIEKIENYKVKRGWKFPWYSSFRSDFNYDFHVTLDPSVAPVVYNWRSWDDDNTDYPQEAPGRSHFLRVGDRIFHTNSIYARGLETIGGSYYLLDETALGRQEEWEEPKGRAADARAAVPDFAS
jgi:predicted dithiol-disulfide oxidoreductase (DUF899 family)